MTILKKKQDNNCNVVTNKKTISITLKDFFKNNYDKLLVVLSFTLAAFLSFMFLKEYFKLEPVTNEQKSYYSTIAEDIWINGLSYLEDENIKKIKITYINDDLQDKIDNSLVYSNGLSTLDYDNINIYIEFGDFFVEQSNNVIKFTHKGEDKYNTKIVYSNDGCNITYNNKINCYYILLILGTITLGFFGGLILIALFCIIIDFILIPIRKYKDKKELK